MDKKNIKCWAQFTCTVGIYVNGAIVHLCKCLDLNIVAIYLEESNNQSAWHFEVKEATRPNFSF